MNLISETIDPERLSLRQLWALFANLRITALISLLALLCASLGLAFRVGEYCQADLTAITLERPFGMTITEDVNPVQYPYPSLILVPGYRVKASDSDSRIVLTMRKLNSSGLYDKVGEVAAQTTSSRPLSEVIFESGLLGSTAYAQPSALRFDWGRYKGDMRFHETFVSRDTVRRTYDDGAILEYKVDLKGRSILSSLRWIKRPA